MLEMASQVFGNHGCNDFVMENTPENLAFVRDMIVDGDEPDDQPSISADGKKIYLMDWMIMDYCERKLREYAED